MHVKAQLAGAGRGGVRAFDRAACRGLREAEAADETFQRLMKEVRETAETFNTDLKAFRRTLGNAIGRNDKDYQKLRAEKAHVKDEDDDKDAPPAPEPVPPLIRTSIRRSGRPSSMAWGAWGSRCN